MSQQSIEPQVVLTADTSQYEQSMASSAQATTGLGTAIDSVSAKLNQLSKSAGKSLVKIAAADVATITAATAAYASYEKQMSRLAAQSVTQTKLNATSQRSMAEYERSVTSLRKNFGTTTSEAASLTLQLAKMQDHTKPITNLATTFEKMSIATGESSTGLANSLLNLQKIMGTPQTDTKNYADQLTYLAAGANTSATAIADFSAQIAPIGDLIGQTQTEITGVATAFIKAGQAGQPAALAYNKIVSDIAYATQSGSPNLAKYASLIGLTTAQFKELGGTEQVTRIFEELNKQGPEAISWLNRAGLDGMRTQKAITALAASGGIGASIQQARVGYDSDANSRASAEAMKGMTDELGKLRQELQMTAESFGSFFAPAITKTLVVIEKFAGKFNDMMNGPLGDFLKLVMTAVAPIAAFAGGLLLIAGALAKVAGAALLLKSSGAGGLVSGFRGGGTIPAGGAMVPGGRPASWFQRGMYNIGAQVGGVAGGLYTGLTGRQPGTGPGFQQILGRGVGFLGSGVRAGTDLMRSVYSPLTMRGWNDPAARMRMIQSPTIMGSFGSAGMTGMSANVAGLQAQQAAQMAGASRLTAAFAGLVGSSRSVSGGFVRLGASMASATTQLAALGAKGLVAGGRAIGAGGPLVGMGLLAGGSALGMDSSALTLGAMGLMMAGPVGGAVGTAAGIGIDVYGANKAQAEQEKNFQEALSKGLPSDVMATGAAIDKEWAKTQALGTPGGGWTNKLGIAGHLGIPDTYGLGQMFGQSKMGLEALFTGENPVEERLNAKEKSLEERSLLLGSLSGIASRKGDTSLEKFDTSSEADWKKLDQVVANISPNMEKLDVTIEDITKAYDLADDSEEGRKAWVKLMNDLSSPGEGTGMWGRVRAGGGAGAAMLGSADARMAIRFQENADYFFKGVDDISNTMLNQGKGWRQIARSAEVAQGLIEDENSREYELQQAASAQAQEALQFRMPLMGRAQQFRASTGMTASLIAGTMEGPQTNENVQQRQDLQKQLYGGMAEQAQYFQQMMLQQKQFELSQDRALEDFGTSRARMEDNYNLSRARAQESFNLQRKYQEEDYQLSRQRAERDYSKQVSRSTESYERSMSRAHHDFNRSRRQQDQDYAHQQELMIKQSAMEMYDIYQRVQVQRTHSTGFLMVNAQDQLQRMQQQEKNLELLRGMGMTQDAIQTLGLGKSENAQQLQRMVTEMQANPELIQQMNAAVGERMKAAGELVTDESSAEWDEFTRQHKISARRASNEFERSVARSHKDFNLQMKQMDQDFKQQMSDQAENYETSQDRQQKAFSKSMKQGAEDYAIAVDQMTEDFGKSMARAQEDMDLMAEHIGGNLKEIFTKAAGSLKGKIGEQAQSALDTFLGLDESLGDAGVKIMLRMAQVFGFEYTPPKWYKPNSGPPGLGPHHGGTPVETPGGANGMVLPGRSIGRDNMHFYSPEHGGLNLAGGEAIMVPEFVDMMGGPEGIKKLNAKARYGRHMAEGGVVWPLPNSVASTYAGHDGVDLNAPGDFGAPYLAAVPGSISYVGTGRGYGIAVFEKGPYGELVYGHSSKAMVKAGQTVNAGDILGLVGSTGHSTGPHLHFGFPGGTYAEALGFLHGAKHLPSPEVAGGMFPDKKIGDILKDKYPYVEAAAAGVLLNGGLFEEGFWSKDLNKRTWKAVRGLKGAAEGGIFADPDIIGIGEKGPEMVLPLNGQGIDFLADLMNRVSAGTEGRAGNVRGSSPMVVHTLNTYQIDRSATFTGDITVTANNPNELVAALRARQRTAAMANPAMGGNKI